MNLNYPTYIFQTVIWAVICSWSVITQYINLATLHVQTHNNSDKLENLQKGQANSYDLYMLILYYT